jgi:hypothetical protein
VTPLVTDPEHLYEGDYVLVHWNREHREGEVISAPADDQCVSVALYDDEGPTGDVARVPPGDVKLHPTGRE